MDLALLYIFTVAAVSEPPAFDLDSSYYRYVPMPYDAAFDTTRIMRAVDSAAGGQSALKISGAKDFSFDVNQGFDQGLKVDISGEVEGVSIEGSLSDKATPSSTVRISEVERVSVRVFTKNFSGGLGNLTLELPFGIADEIRGGRLGLRTDDEKNKVNAAYAINRGAHRRLQFTGEEGKQSPYFLQGAVIPGSERVHLTQGLERPVLLERDTDYKVDYVSGILSFTNKQIITSHTRIEVEYQEAIEDYVNIYRQIDGRTGAGDIEVSGLYRATVDEKDDPLTFTLSPAEIESLVLAGDSARVQHTYADTTSEGSYVLQNDHFVYVGQGNGDYDVTFFYVGEANGEYVYDPALSAFVYLGPGLGNYSPTRPLPLPRREEFYALSGEFFKTLTLHVYGSRLDQNTFSPLDDADNSGYGYRARVDRRVGFASVKAEYVRYGKTFYSPARREEIDHRYVWNTEESLSDLADISVGLAPAGFLKMDMGYGLLNRQHKRRVVTVHPYFFSFGYEAVDTVEKYFAGFARQWTRVMLNGRYERYGTVQIVRYGTDIAVTKGISAGIRGTVDRDTMSSGMMNTFNLNTSGLSLSLGHRSLNDTTFFFGNAALRYSGHGLSLFADVQQTQRYSQKRDETYVRVGEGQGDYVYDPATGTYIRKEGGDYVRKVFLLPEFTRVITRNYAAEAGYAGGFYSLSGRLYYVDEEEYRSHSEDAVVNFNAADYDITLLLRQNFQEDRRYALAGVSTRERSAALLPSVNAFSGRVEIQTSVDQTGGIERERKNTYRAEASYEILSRPVVRPRAGYAYSIIGSGYFDDLDIRQHTPGTGILLGIPVKRIQGKVETTADFVYRRYNTDEIPYLFTANEPEGLTTILGAFMSFGVGANTVFSMIYRVEFRPDEKPNQNMRLQSRIRF